MNKDFLKRYKKNYFEVGRLKEEISFWESKAKSPGITNFDNLGIRGNSHTDSLELYLEKIKRNEIRIAELEVEMDKIVETILMMKDDRYRSLLMKHYIEFKSFKEIAQELFLSVQTVYNLHQNALVLYESQSI